MIQDKIFFDEKDPTGLSYNTPFTYYGSYQGRLWSKSPTGSIKYYTQNSDLSAYATTGSNQFSGSQTITGSLTVTGTITGTVAGTTSTASYVEYTNVANKPALVSGSAQIASFGIFATTGSNGFNGSQSITGSLTVTGQVVAQTLNVQQVTSSIVYSSGSNVFGNTLGNTQQFTGSVGVTGSLSVNGASSFSSNVTATGNLNLQGAVTRNINFYDSSNTNINAQIQYDQISSTSGQLFFGTNNAGTFATRLTISNTGAATFSNNVGINGVSPTYPLYVRTGTNQRARFVDNGGLFQFGVLNDAEGAYSDMSLGNSAIMIKSSGNVGIGTTSPNPGGSISGTTVVTISPQSSVSERWGILELAGNRTLGGNQVGEIKFTNINTTNNVVASITATNTATAVTGGALFFSTKTDAGSLAERMTITSGGSINFSGTDATTQYYFGYNRPTATNLLVNGTNNNKIRIQNVESDVVVLNSNGNSYFNGGNIGIGTTNPSQKLHLIGGNLQTAGNSSYYRNIFEVDVTTWSNVVSFTPQSSTQYTAGFINITASGYVNGGLGTGVVTSKWSYTISNNVISIGVVGSDIIVGSAPSVRLIVSSNVIYVQVQSYNTAGISFTTVYVESFLGSGYINSTSWVIS